MLKKRLGHIVLILAATIISLLIAEGSYALSRGTRLDSSITFKTVAMLKEMFGRKRATDVGVYAPIITKEKEFRSVLDGLKADGVGLGNSIFDELKSERANINTFVDGCRVQKPNLDKEGTFLRAGLFDPFDLVTAFYDTGATLSPEVRAFIDKYGTRRIRHRTNAWGERLTLPLVQSDDKVLVAGDSVANGTMVNDDETLASRLQALDPSRQYVNLGVAGAYAHEIACSLERAAKRYSGQIRELVYIYCENDFKPDKPLGVPEDMVAWLTEFVRQEGIENTTIVYAPYIYNIVPHITRFRGYQGGRYRSHKDERDRLVKAVEEAGFAFVDMADLALKEIDLMGTQFAALSLFVDHVHWSPLGSSKLAEHLVSERTH